MVVSFLQLAHMSTRDYQTLLFTVLKIKLTLFTVLTIKRQNCKQSKFDGQYCKQRKFDGENCKQRAVGGQCCIQRNIILLTVCTHQSYVVYSMALLFFIS
jgi:hypothetical protein